MFMSKAYSKAKQRIDQARRDGSTTLDLSRMGLTKVPEAIGKLTNLQELNLSYNQISSLPEVLVKLTSLQRLYLMENQISSLPEGLEKLTSLQELILCFNQISSLPEGLGKLTSLQKLNLSGNEISSLPEGLGKLTSLQELILYTNKISSLPEGLGKLTSLQKLNLSGNEISSLPEGLGKLTSLQELILYTNKISSLPEGLGKLTSLQKLNLSGNEISSLPEGLGKLTSLQELNLWENQISSLPEGLGKLTSLQRLHLRDNQISSLPEGLGKLTSLQRLNLDNNPLNLELAAAYSQGTAVVLEYLRSQARSRQVELNEAKLIMVGEGEVGKTSLLGALCGDKWVENRPTTHGIEIKSFTVKVPDSGKEIKLNGWDFGGQPVYRPTHQLFFSAPAVYLVLWKPREGPQQNFIEYWINLIKHRAPEAKILVVATHGGPNARQPDIDSDDITTRFGGDTVLGFFHVDSKSDATVNPIGIDELKEAIARAASLPEVGRKVPAKWQQLREKLQTTAKAYISYDEVITLCAEQEMDKSEANLFLGISHTLGHLIHYHNDNLLKNIVILKPDWLAKAISFVLDDKETRKNGGLVKFSRLNQLWNDPQREETERYPEELHPIFRKLMERFDLSYRVAVDPLRKLLNMLVGSDFHTRVAPAAF
ncbi:MAG: leucine-rich repeat domain-containing protein [Hormoscilla sp. GUM202]|nr:leucine-rich repeat domain-containing protein [Hormoscilla sp. GUM202]